MQAIAAAREMLHPEYRTEGMRPGLTLYVSQQTHNSSEKAALLLGFGRDNIRRIPVDSEFRMQPAALAQAIVDDIAAGKTPCCIVASVGSTSTTAIEPVPAIADIAERHGIWLHIDAAYGGSAAVIPAYRHILDGVERAHSLILNPHKWLNVGFDCSVLYTRFPDILRRSVSLSAEYLKTPEDDQVVNYMDYGLQLGRRFRSLKLWYVMRAYGREGMIDLIQKSIDQAQLLKRLIEADPDYEIAAPVPFSLVCFRHRGSNELNQLLMAEINASGKAFLSHTILNGKYVIRCAFGNYLTTDFDVHDTWKLIQQTALHVQPH
jgi:aromatic-L-amino-acid decarboxylase